MTRSQLLAAAAGMGHESGRAHAAISATLAVVEIRWQWMKASVIDLANHKEILSSNSTSSSSSSNNAAPINP
jgi:hypothetical protein